MKISNLIAAALLTVGAAAVGTVFLPDTFASEAQTDASVAEAQADTSEAASEPVAAPDVTFTTYRGSNKKDEYSSFTGADGKVYLFLPSDANLAKVTITSSAKIVSTTVGSVSEDGKTLSGDFRDQPASLVMEDGNRLILVCTQSSLPSLSMRLNDAKLDDIKEDSETVCEIESAILTDPMDPSNDFNLKGHMEFHGRGNSSWAYYDKRGYQLKLENSRSVLGMSKAKKWVLLANSSDSTLMRNKIIFDTARALDVGYAPQSRYADLWIDGDYSGLYLISEKAEISKQRLNLQSGHGILAEFDNAFYYEEENFKDINENHWALKDYQSVGYKEDFKEFENRVNNLAAALNDMHPWEEITTMIDEDQFAKFYLIAEYFLNEELPTTSFYWYWDGPGDELHLGPIWDFDTCMQDGDPADMYYVWHNGYFKRLLMYSEFNDLLESYYNNVCSEVLQLAPTTMDLLNIKINPSAEMNYLRYDVLGKKDVKDHMFYSTYKENLENQKQWLNDRAEHFSVADICADLSDYFMTAKVSEDSSTLSLELRTKKDLKSLQFYVETAESQGADRTRYEAVHDESGKWVYDVDLIDFNKTGEYRIEAYVNGTTGNADATATVTVDQMPTVSYRIDGVDYSPVFDPAYYAERYPDAKNACGDNASKLFKHFTDVGMKDRRQGSAEFDIDFYMRDNPELTVKYGTDYSQYYRHYCEFGKAEGRKGTRKGTAGN